MKTYRCPYLGLKDDPGTAMDFPSLGNFCQKAAPPDAVRLDYQQSTCLTEQHAGCPVYLAAVAGPLPERLRLTAAPAAQPRRALWLVLPALLLLVGLVLALGARTGLLARARIPISGQPVDQQPGFDLFSLNTTLPGTAMPLNFASTLDAGRLAPNGAVCPQPQDWIAYTVNPTDSLYRLAVVYGVPVETLQRQNCMGTETVLTPGQVIYVPFSPTETPVPTNTFTRVWPTWTPTSPPIMDTPVPGDTDTPPEPPIVTDTPVPPAVPPSPTPTEGSGGNNDSQVIDCGGKSVSVDGNNNDIIFTGVCTGLTVSGNKNNISVPAGTPVTDTGNNNEISFY